MNERILEIRKYFHLTQSEFGAKIGLSRDGIASYERGTAKPTGVAIQCIVSVFGVSRHWLETGEGEMLVQTNDSLLDQLVDKYSLTPMEAGIMAKFIRMDAEQRAMFLDIARSLLDAGSQAQSEAVAREVVSRAVPPEPESQIG